MTTLKQIETYVKANMTTTIKCLPEDMPVRGNLIDSGDKESDKIEEDKIIEDYENGNDWAWCIAQVTCQFEGISKAEYLGGSSYKSEAAFLADSYFEDMKNEAANKIAKTIFKLISLDY